MSIKMTALEAGLNLLSKAAWATLLPIVVQKEQTKQEEDYKRRLKRVMDAYGYAREEAVSTEGEFVLDEDKAARLARSYIEMCIRRRLESAILLYHSGQELDCLRHVLLSLGTVFQIVGFELAARSLTEYCDVLFARIREKRVTELAEHARSCL